jgi:hypothetical protein
MLTPPELLMAQLMAVIRAHMAAEPDAFKVKRFITLAHTELWLLYSLSVLILLLL